MGQVVEMQTKGGEKKRDLLFETVAEVCGVDITQLTKSARGALNRACSELRDMDPSTDEIRRRAEMFRQRYENATLTPNALVKHWPQLTPPPEDRWQMAVRLAKERGLERFKGAPYETPGQFMRRVFGDE